MAEAAHEGSQEGSQADDMSLATPVGPAIPLNKLFERFVAFEPRNMQVVSVDSFTKIATQLQFQDRLPGMGKFRNGKVTFTEVARTAGVDLSNLPVSLNVLAEAFRKADVEQAGKVQLLAFVKKLRYFYDVQLNVADELVSFEQGVDHVRSPTAPYKLNVFKDMFRRFGADGDGTLSKEELYEAANFLGIQVDTDKERLTMNDVMPLVVNDANHPVFKLEVDMNEVRKAFDWCDPDHVGVLQSDLLAKALRLSGQSPSQADFKTLKGELDQNNGGVFDFDDFTSIVCRTFVVEEDQRKRALDAFAVFDTENTGRLSVADLRRILTTYGEDMSEEEVDELFEEVQVLEDGKVDLVDFVQLLME